MTTKENVLYLETGLALVPFHSLYQRNKAMIAIGEDFQRELFIQGLQLDMDTFNKEVFRRYMAG